MSKQQKGKTYQGRGIHSQKIEASLVNGKLSQMMSAIQKANQEAAKASEKLDVQIRNNYLNIYYRGSNIARVWSDKRVEFDKFYFYNSSEGFNIKKKIVNGKKVSVIPKKNIMKDDRIVSQLEKKSKPLICLFKEAEYEKYFNNAKGAIDNWLADHGKSEREAQHKMVACQTLKGYTIIDIEFQVSERSEYVCTYLKAPDKYAKPRFDIIALNEDNEICVLELKKGLNALEGTSGLKEHWECFKNSVGDAKRNKPFIDEIKKLLSQKKVLGLIEWNGSIPKDDVRFLFAYEFEGCDHDKEKAEFYAAYKREFQSVPDPKIEVIWINDGKICK